MTRSLYYKSPGIALYHRRADGSTAIGTSPLLVNENSQMFGDCTNLHGRAHNLLRGDVSNISGDPSGIYGDVSGLAGDVTGVIGCATGVHGHLFRCELTPKEREAGVLLSDLVRPGAAPQSNNLKAVSAVFNDLHATTERRGDSLVVKLNDAHSLVLHEDGHWTFEPLPAAKPTSKTL